MKRTSPVVVCAHMRNHKPLHGLSQILWLNRDRWRGSLAECHHGASRGCRHLQVQLVQDHLWAHLLAGGSLKSSLAAGCRHRFSALWAFPRDSHRVTAHILQSRGSEGRKVRTRARNRSHLPLRSDFSLSHHVLLTIDESPGLAPAQGEGIMQDIATSGWGHQEP